ncbi:MAG: hypothetical protein QME81_04340 [bacterium]|nr:hypothetical protein [bacterium]
MALSRFDASGNIILVNIELTSLDESEVILLPTALDTGATFTIIPWDI